MNAGRVKGGWCNYFELCNDKPTARNNPRIFHRKSLKQMDHIRIVNEHSKD